ncbi:MAG: hypothetical protein ACI8PB_002579 [Desulforhopalus sp.]|jgi:hypothetical protein
MDTDTIIIMGFTVAAFLWWFVLRVQEDRQYAKELVEQQRDKLERAEKVKVLTNKR